jgi:hypothetical protein
MNLLNILKISSSVEQSKEHSTKSRFRAASGRNDGFLNTKGATPAHIGSRIWKYFCSGTRPSPAGQRMGLHRMYNVHIIAA